MTTSRSRVDILLPLRGIASFAVAWFHFTHGTPSFLPDGWLKASGHYGWLGVEMFFVISGFVIPWSLYHGCYERGEHWKRFIAKRVIRLDPPYLASIALVLCATWLASKSSSFRGLPLSQQVSWGQLLAHLGYANAILHYEWLNLVYWTLAIEAMYYVLIGWGFPYLQRPGAALGVYLVIGASPFLIPDERWIFHYLPLFGMGIAAFQFATTDRRLHQWVMRVVGLAIVSAVKLSIPIALTGVATALCIVFAARMTAPALAWLGTISYSLYLVHVPIGGKIVNLGARYAHSLPAELLVLAIAIGASLGAAWVLWYCVERPAQSWSSAITYARAEYTEMVRPTVIEPAL